MKLHQMGTAVPKRGNKITKWLGSAVLSVLGWQIVGQVPNLPKFVMIGAPHTSNWDFPLAMLLFMALGVRVSWMGKHTFVDGPLKRLWHWLGGVAIDRQAAHGIVEQMVNAFNSREKFILGITPEGTRRKVTEWKTGFYHIAHGARIPILPVAINYPVKTFSLHPIFLPSGKLQVDLPQIQSLYAHVQGKRPHLA